MWSVFSASEVSGEGAGGSPGLLTSEPAFGGYEPYAPTPRTDRQHFSASSVSPGDPSVTWALLPHFTDGEPEVPLRYEVIWDPHQGISNHLTFLISFFFFQIKF